MRKVIKLDEAQIYALKKYLTEYPSFGTTQDDSFDSNTQSEISVNPDDNLSVDTINQTSDDFRNMAGAGANRRYWTTGYTSMPMGYPEREQY